MRYSYELFGKDVGGKIPGTDVPMPLWNAAHEKTPGNSIPGQRVALSSPIQTLTVGPGISPGQPLLKRFADYDRRWGITPRPEDIAVSNSYLIKRAVKITHLEIIAYL